MTALQRAEYRKRWWWGPLPLWRYLSFIFLQLSSQHITEWRCRTGACKAKTHGSCSLIHQFLDLANYFFSILGLFCPECFFKTKDESVIMWKSKCSLSIPLFFLATSPQWNYSGGVFLFVCFYLAGHKAGSVKKKNQPGNINQHFQTAFLILGSPLMKVHLAKFKFSLPQQTS